MEDYELRNKLGAIFWLAMCIFVALGIDTIFLVYLIWYA